MKKRILFASVLLLLLSTYNIQKSSNLNFEFNIEKIDIESIDLNMYFIPYNELTEFSV